jgi:hypothetical protein
MKRPRLQQENPSEAKFCLECATPLVLELRSQAAGRGQVRRLMQPAAHRKWVAAYAETMVVLEGR